MHSKHQIVLCVDDDPDDQMMVLDTIMEIDPAVKVTSAFNGVEAMRFLTEASERGELPCLVLMDINMPLMDGKQALSLIKKDKSLAQVPVVLFTTSSSELDKAFAALHGVELITKPINHKELHHSVRRVLNKCSLK